LGAAALSTLSAVVSAVPGNYPAPEVKAIRQLLKATQTREAGGLGAASEIAEARVSQLEAANRSNNLKAALIFASFAAFGVGALALIAALLFGAQIS
jgi:hypothetical protein